MRHVTRAFLSITEATRSVTPAMSRSPARWQKVVPGVGVVTQQIPFPAAQTFTDRRFSPSVAQFIVILRRGIGLRLIISNALSFYGSGTAPLAQEINSQSSQDTNSDLDRNDADRMRSKIPHHRSTHEPVQDI